MKEDNIGCELDCEVGHDVSPSITDAIDVDSIDLSPQIPTNPKVDFNPTCYLRDKADCVPAATSGQSVVVECTEVGEQSVIHSPITT